MQNGLRSDDFLWGVATSAYQSEGGYNGPGQPQTNWATAEASKEVAPVGNAAEFWTRFRSDFELCRDLGLNAFRLSIEWSRVQPTHVNRESKPPLFDYAALDHYVEMLAASREAGLEPILTLHHFVHPAWLGADPWLRPETVDVFARYVSEAVRYLNYRLTESYQTAPIHYYITINEPNMLAVNTYLGHRFPSGVAPGFRKLASALCTLFCAHIRAFTEVHTIHREYGWPAPAVSVNNHCSDVYWSDKLWLDLLSLRARRIPRVAVDRHISLQADRFAAAFRRAPTALQKDLPYRIGVAAKHGANAIGRRLFNSHSLGTLLDIIYASESTQLLDYLAVDYYDPFAAHVFRLPVWWDHEVRNKSLGAWITNAVTNKWWDWRVLPHGLRFFCEKYHDEFGLPVLIAENGMALRRPAGEREPHRRDRMTRSEFLRLHLSEVDRVRRAGIPLIGYLHWSLFDNYEWGTYTPRFGLYSIEYAAGADRLAEDHIGDRPAETYAQLISNSRLPEGL